MRSRPKGRRRSWSRSQGVGDLGDRRPQPLQQAPPLIGQRDAARRAMQQADAETLLQLSHRMAERRG
jgi:hypothetical protein